MFISFLDIKHEISPKIINTISSGESNDLNTLSKNGNNYKIKPMKSRHRLTPKHP